ncbi:GNAT family N-acetyltransferase [Candidatus Saccharibacteria bacterium]|nr:GNAT family N-acetyltransferase [Candidatus Saccharibacteria bacterium]
MTYEVRRPNTEEELQSIQQLRHAVLDQARLHQTDTALSPADFADNNFHMAVFLGSMPVAALRGDLLGRGLFQFQKVATATEFQGQGLGTRLMQSAEAEAIALGAHSIILASREGRVQDFYENLGFTVMSAPFTSPDGVKNLWMEKWVGPYDG